LQGFHDQVVLAKPLTKFVHRVTNVEEIPRLTAYAYRMAGTGAPGPVLVDFPIDVLFSPPVTEVSLGAVMMPPVKVPSPSVSDVEAILGLWKKAKRPVIITGTGARGVGGSLLKVAEATRTPVFYSSKFSNAIPLEHELRGGPAANLAALMVMGKPQSDFTILLGARTGFLLGGRSGAIVPNKDCTIVQVDVDGGEIGKSAAIEWGIVSDATMFLDAVLTQLGKDAFPDNWDWTKTASSLHKIESPFEKEAKVAESGRIHPYHGVKALFEALPSDCIISIDGGEVGVWALGLMEKARPGLVMASTGYLGFLGNGWGYSIGAAVAEPTKQIINIQGDGSACFHIAELDTFARHNLNILTVVVNNHMWGMSYNGQELVYGTITTRPVSQLSPKCKFEIVAQGFDCEGMKVEKLEEVEAAVQKLCRHQGPGLINLLVNDKPISVATRSMVNADVDPKKFIVVPYYDNVERLYPLSQLEGRNGANGH
jgi:thiamine pyrophosphate-dependent acetolactate synthase large subunit-like protein